MKNLEQRLRALEDRLRVESITLHMADGTIRRVRANGLSILKHANAALNGKLDGIGEAIIHSVSDDSDGNLIDLLRSIGTGPVETPVKQEQSADNGAQ